MNIRFILVAWGVACAAACGKSDGSASDSETGGSAGHSSKAGSVSASGGTAGSATTGGSSSSAGTNSSAGRAGHAGSSATSGEGGEVTAAGAAGAGMSGAGGDGGEAGETALACLALATSCEFSSECCSNYCKTETHKCVAPERCPVSCAPGTYCVPSFDNGPNTCAPAPTPKCQGNTANAQCNRCVVKSCPAETVYCGCTDECFGGNGGCLPTCGPSFAGFNECMSARCHDECGL